MTERGDRARGRQPAARKRAGGVLLGAAVVSMLATPGIPQESPGQLPPPPCDVPGVRVFDRALPGGGVRLVARQTTTAPTTIRLTTTLANLVPDRPVPALQTLPGVGEFVLVDLKFEQPGKPWSFKWADNWISGRLGARQDPAAIYQLPWAAGAAHRVVQGPHNSASWYSGGCALDFNLPEGTPVHAAREGVVAGFQDECTKAGPGGTPSNFVLIDQPDGTLGDYEHLKRDGVAVAVGQRVRAGDVIGYSGNTGASSGPHLHFGVLAVTPELGWAPQRLLFRVAGERDPVELVQGRSYTRP